MTRLLAYCLLALGASTLLVLSQAELGQSPGASDPRNQSVDAETVRRLTPTAEGLRRRFGRVDSGNNLPDVFVLGSNLKVSVKYGSDRLACSIEIEPLDIVNPYLPKEKISRLLDELAPSAMRGKILAGYSEFRSSCVGAGTAAYENVFISHWPNYCAPEHPATEKKATIQFVRDLCPNPYIRKRAEPANSR